MSDSDWKSSCLCFRYLLLQAKYLRELPFLSHFDDVSTFELMTSLHRWLSTRLEITGHCVIFLTALISVLRADSMDAAQAALAISAAMGVSLTLTLISWNLLTMGLSLLIKLHFCE